MNDTNPTVQRKCFVSAITAELLWPELKRAAFFVLVYGNTFL